MLKLWEKRTVFGESVLFRDGVDSQLLFVPESMPKVYSPETGEAFIPDRDFIWVPGTRKVMRTENSRIAKLDWLAKPKDDPEVKLFPADGANAIAGGGNDTVLRFAPSTYFADTRVAVDYTAAADIDIQLPVSAKKPVRFLNKLRAGQQVKLCAVGDSITDGWHATAKFDHPPFGKPYIELVTDMLNLAYGKNLVQLCNHAVSGTGCAHAKEITDKWLDDTGDLLVIAYGMNDFGGTEAERYRSEINNIIDTAAAYRSETDFILVASMPRNELWHPNVPHRHQEFADALYDIAARRENVCVADVHNLWCNILARKDYYDLTGNGVNHPNDYGHRIYASAVCGCF